jgi:putative toxin-antitoxin system antitoxin component (TIGR02293 family)
MAGELRRGVLFKPGKKKRTVLASPKKRATKASDDESQVMDRAVEVIGDKKEAMRWMGTPVRALDYSTPVSLLGTRKGRQAVIAVLGRLEHGVL